MGESQLCITTESLTKRFGSLLAVDDLSLSIESGTCFGLLGPNGAGKTTTVRILSGLMRPTSGAAKTCGYDVYKERDRVKAITGLLPETPGIYSKLSAVEFLEFLGSLNGLSGSPLHKRIDSLLSTLGLEQRMDDLLETYSSGMKQKVLVAATILHEPQLVFFDEPTSRLDPAASALVKDLITVLSKDTKTSFFICTHMTALAEDICDTVGILSQGRLVAIGTPEEIMVSTKTASLEEAYLSVVGGKVDPERLLAWR